MTYYQRPNDTDTYIARPSTGRPETHARVYVIRDRRVRAYPMYLMDVSYVELRDVDRWRQLTREEAARRLDATPADLDVTEALL